VHIGQDDGPIAGARAAAGSGKLVGRSTHSLAQARAARAEGADYLGFGPLFATPTKPDYPAIGLEDIAQAHAEVPDRPIFCIGGIKLENLAEVIAAGARRVVIVSGILLAPDVAAYTRQAADFLREAAD
jgi:thiamine-phosphate pyrophosphorylase